MEDRGGSASAMRVGATCHSTMHAEASRVPALATNERRSWCYLAEQQGVAIVALGDVLQYEQRLAAGASCSVCSLRRCRCNVRDRRLVRATGSATTTIAGSAATAAAAAGGALLALASLSAALLAGSRSDVPAVTGCTRRSAEAA